ncbi:MAG: hypothetical protein HOQ28_14460 [Thermoleophilia bacterium]|nr:hypothetical protein [Thermoleophilia bacterium]
MTRQRELIDAVLDSVADGVVVSSPAQVLLNATARRILGLGPDAEFDLAAHRRYLQAELTASQQASLSGPLPRPGDVTRRP